MNTPVTREFIVRRKSPIIVHEKPVTALDVYCCIDRLEDDLYIDDRDQTIIDLLFAGF